MTTNKVHDPKNTECEIYGDIHESEVECEHPCTCEKQQQAPQEPAPTSVTGEEWEVFWKEVQNQVGLTLNIGRFHTYIENRLTQKERSGIKNLIDHSLSAQRTHIKQALLGRLEGVEWKENTSNDTPTTAYTSETHRNNGYNNGIKDAKLIVNEELA